MLTGHPLPDTGPTYTNPNWLFNVMPNLLIASVSRSSGAAAKVTLKNMSLSGEVISARNQLPQDTSTPSSIAAWNMASSTVRWLFPARAAGCRRHSTFIQCYHYIVRDTQTLFQTVNSQTSRLPEGANLQHLREGIFRTPSTRHSFSWYIPFAD